MSELDKRISEIKEREQEARYAKWAAAQRKKEEERQARMRAAEEAKRKQQERLAEVARKRQEAADATQRAEQARKLAADVEAKRRQEEAAQKAADAKLAAYQKRQQHEDARILRELDRLAGKQTKPTAPHPTTAHVVTPLEGLELLAKNKDAKVRKLTPIESLNEIANGREPKTLWAVETRAPQASPGTPNSGAVPGPPSSPPGPIPRLPSAATTTNPIGLADAPALWVTTPAAPPVITAPSSPPSHPQASTPRSANVPQTSRTADQVVLKLNADLFGPAYQLSSPDKPRTVAPPSQQALQNAPATGFAAPPTTRATPQPIAPSTATRILPYAQMANDAYNDYRRDGFAPTGYKRDVDWTTILRRNGASDGIVDLYKKSGFSAAIYRNQTSKQIAIAYRGSQGSILNDPDWVTNRAAREVVGPNTHLEAQYIAAASLAARIRKENPEYEIVLTGHSLGGGLASYAGSWTGSEVVTFNAAGNAYSTRGNNPRQLNVIVPGDIVGDSKGGVAQIIRRGAGELPGTTVTVNSTRDGRIERHFMDGMLKGLADSARP